ncbi:uncharacterized protein LOC130992840 [Salvia miltiorrhiza]|uniref:uncharacterized protein LOC130992840 n=1 Tax=Salvia miltiorrhiza TaxID=226208 RepID=UPI0025ABF7D0|nr:uncharacterized protein LOC130992840 [Salvia miltiorrhiza]
MAFHSCLSEGRVPYPTLGRRSFIYFSDAACRRTPPFSLHFSFRRLVHLFSGEPLSHLLPHAPLISWSDRHQRRANTTTTDSCATQPPPPLLLRRECRLPPFPHLPISTSYAHELNSKHTPTPSYSLISVHAIFYNYTGDLPKALLHFLECGIWYKSHSVFLTSAAPSLFCQNS